jgi:histidinol-phosphate aminotransferase
MDFKKLMRPHLENVKPYVPGKPIEELRRERNIEGEIIKLASNENPYQPLEEIKRMVIEELDNINRYPNSGSHYLSLELSEKHGLEQGQIFVGNGSNEILDLLVRAFVSPNEEVMYPFPSFIAYPLIIHQAGVLELKVPLSDYTLDLCAMKEAVTSRTKMVFICNPNNPTGTYVTEGDVIAFLEEIRNDVIVVFDEAYFEYVTATDYPDSRKLLDRFRNIVILRTFSKAYSLSGVRIGYAMADPEVVTILHMVRQPFNVNRLAQAAARAALRHSEALADRIEENNSERSRVAKELLELGFTVPESQTNFLLAVPGGPDSNIVDRLMDLGIIVRSGAPWGLGTESFRVSIGTPAENNRFLEGLHEVLEQES